MSGVLGWQPYLNVDGKVFMLIDIFIILVINKIINDTFCIINEIGNIRYVLYVFLYFF